MKINKTNNLPEMCFAENEGKVVVIKNGVNGYFEWYDNMVVATPEKIKQLNEGIGVTENQQKAMLGGSMFGWHIKMVTDFDEKNFKF